MVGHPTVHLVKQRPRYIAHPKKCRNFVLRKMDIFRIIPARNVVFLLIPDYSWRLATSGIGLAKRGGSSYAIFTPMDCFTHFSLFISVSISLRSLLVYAETTGDSELRRLVERRLSEFPEARLVLERIRAVASALLRAPGLVEVRAKDDSGTSFQDELDPNLVAEYLDHQLSHEDERNFETVCFSSDVYLAEVVCVNSLLSNVIVHPANTTMKIRAKLYRISNVSRFSTNTDQNEPDEENDSLPNVDESSNYVFPETPQVVLHNPVSTDNATNSDKKKVRESLDEWKQKRSSRLRNAIIIITFLVVSVCVWRYSEQIRQFDFVKNRGEAVISESTGSQLEAAPLFQETVGLTDWENSPDNYLYENLESPEMVLKNADPDLASPKISRAVSESYTNTFDTQQVSGTASQPEHSEPMERRKLPLIYTESDPIDADYSL